MTNKDKVINELLKRISDLEFEVERLMELCDKYEEEHRTTFEEWKKTINIIKEVRELLESDYFEDGSFTNYEKVFELLKKENNGQ